MTSGRPLVDIIGDAVKAASCEVLASLKKCDSSIIAVNYIYGPAEEIRETLKQYDESPGPERFKKYPLIALITPFQEQPGNIGGYAYKAYPKIGIAHHSDKDQKSSERYTANIKGVLLPLYDAFISALVDSGEIVCLSERDLKITRQIRDDIGRKPFLNLEGMTFDYIDAIEITNIELVVDYQDCYSQCN